MNSKTKGFIYGAIAAASYGMNPLFTLPLYAAGMSVDTVLFYRYFFAVIVLGILMKMQHHSSAGYYGIVVFVFFLTTVHELQLYGCRNRVNDPVRLSGNGSGHYGSVL